MNDTVEDSNYSLAGFGIDEPSYVVARASVPIKRSRKLVKL